MMESDVSAFLFPGLPPPPPPPPPPRTISEYPPLPGSAVQKSVSNNFTEEEVSKRLLDELDIQFHFEDFVVFDYNLLDQIEDHPSHTAGFTQTKHVKNISTDFCHKESSNVCILSFQVHDRLSNTYTIQLRLREPKSQQPVDGRGIENLTVTVRPARRRSQPAFITVCLLDAEQNLLSRGFQHTYLDKSLAEET